MRAIFGSIFIEPRVLFLLFFAICVLGRGEHDGAAHGRQSLRRSRFYHQEPRGRREGVERGYVSVRRRQGGGRVEGQERLDATVNVSQGPWCGYYWWCCWCCWC